MDMKKAFTLIEMMVVVGIVGILAGILLVSLTGSSDSARAAKCLANMRSLAAAVQSSAVATGYYPYAGSIESMYMDSSRGTRNMELKYTERKGWISWDSEGKYPCESKGGAPLIPMCTDNDRLATYALTNGALWKYVGGGKSVFVCPDHTRIARNVRWSYLMNAYFGWSSSDGYAYSSRHAGVKYSTLSGADRILLFSEVPFRGAGSWFPAGTGNSTESDAILQYKGCNTAPTVAGPSRRDGNECIGANHRSGKYWVAHVVFADGHAEKIRASASNGTVIDSDGLRELTTWLCEGRAVRFDGKKYEEMK